ncbi:MAG: methyltransferase domain-containing protein [Candidatus Lokiarchaeota archaeon]|nr:methyltransferase domain-containing protein [Candidatus Lokiarchaeota archaeon]
MNKELEHYSHKFTEESSIIKLEYERIKNLLSKIPKSKKILEVGCANGRILNNIKSQFKVGIDIILYPLNKIKANTIRGSISNLPFRKNCYDLIICSEVLEHLDKITFEKSLKELARVSSKFILVSVPFKENLEAKYGKCKKCGNVFHVFLHKRNFNRNGMLSLFNDFKLVKTYFHGKKYQYPDIFRRLKRMTNNFFRTNNVVCPNCGVENACQKINLINKFISLLEELYKYIFVFDKIRREYPSWIICLYKKEKK